MNWIFWLSDIWECQKLKNHLHLFVAYIRGFSDAPDVDDEQLADLYVCVAVQDKTTSLLLIALKKSLAQMSVE